MLFICDIVFDKNQFIEGEGHIYIQYFSMGRGDSKGGKKIYFPILNPTPLRKIASDYGKPQKKFTKSNLII